MYSSKNLILLVIHCYLSSILLVATIKPAQTANYAVRVEDLPRAVLGRTIVYCLKTITRRASSARTLQSYQSGSQPLLFCSYHLYVAAFTVISCVEPLIRSKFISRLQKQTQQNHVPSFQEQKMYNCKKSIFLNFLQVT